MSNPNEYKSPYEEQEEVREHEEREQEERRVFVPKEPDPSTWPVADVKNTMTRGEELFIHVLAGFLAVIMLISVIFFAATADGWTTPSVTPTPPVDTQPDTTPEESVKVPSVNKGPFADGKKGNVLFGDANTVQQIDLSGLSSTNAVLAELSDGKIIAANGADQKVYPASLTKMMTMIVIVEHLRSEAALQEVITISDDIVKAMAAEGASGMGLAAGEQLTVEALLYALMLQSDGVAACQLARYVAGTEEAFVTLMNQKAKSMGLTGTHFMNPTGLHHENHYSTCRDMATILGYAMNMSLCKKIMTKDVFKAPCTGANGYVFEYQIYNNLLITHFNDYKKLKPATAGKLTVTAGKTGYTPESKFCLATCAMAADGSLYICVTVGADGYESCIKAYQAIYSGYAG